MIGQMDQVVEVFVTSYTSDGLGGRERSITSAGQYFANVATITGDEREHADREAYKQAAKFKMHNFSGFPVNTTSYIDWNGQRYDVTLDGYLGAQDLYITYSGVAGEQIAST